MWQALVSVAALLVGVACLQAGSGLYGSFAAMRMELEDFPTVAIGAIGSAYFLGFALGSLRTDRMIAQVGHIRTFAALASALCVMTLLQGMEVAPWPWAATRLVQGFATAGLFVVSESWVNDRTTPEMRGQVFAIYMIVNYIALGLAQFLLPLSPIEGERHFLMAASLFALCLLPVALTRAQTPTLFEAKPLSFRRLVAISPLGFVGCIACGAMNGAFYAVTPVYAVQQGFTTGQVATLMGTVIVAGLVLQWPVGKLSDIFDRRRILVAMAGGTAVVALAIGLLSGVTFWGLVGLACLYGGLAFTLYPVSVAHANDMVAREDLVALASGLLLSFGLGAVIGPLAASAAMDAFGGAALWFYIAAVASLLTGFGAYRMYRRPPVPAAEQGPFVAMPRTSPMVLQFDPRTPANDDAGEATVPADAAEPGRTLPSDQPGAGG